MNHVGHYFQQVRESRGLTRDDVARQLGFTRWKAMRRLTILEEAGEASNDFLVKMTEVFGLDWADVEEVIDVLKWLNIVADE